VQKSKKDKRMKSKINKLSFQNFCSHQKISFQYFLIHLMKRHGLLILNFLSLLTEKLAIIV
jgi:hypothetical protein